MSKPNILILMCDQLRGDVIRPDHRCLTPNLDRLHARGLRIEHGYAANAICSPSRASMMTGLMPHNHGVLTVTHCVDDDQSCLRTEHPHFAQRLAAAGYHTGYFGKWHVERTEKLDDFGWKVGAEAYADRLGEKFTPVNKAQQEWSLRFEIDGPEGYSSRLHYGVTSAPVEQRGVGRHAAMASEFLKDAMSADEPWMCMVSLGEPHDPYVCGEKVFKKYDPAKIELPPTLHDDGLGQPNIYRKVARAYAPMTDEQHREAIACYYASVTEIDEQFGKLMDQVDKAGQLDNTIIILTSDHGDMLGEHRLYCKNISGFESVYHIPMTLAGPGIASGESVNARVGLHDLAPTLCELAGADPIDVPDSRSFAPLLREPQARAHEFQTGVAEFFGVRFPVAQRVIWDGPWKYCLNAFDFDELYNLDDDPHEMHNLATDPTHADRVEHMLRIFWRYDKATGDHALTGAQYSGIRTMIPLGPGIAEDEA